MDPDVNGEVSDGRVNITDTLLLCGGEGSRLHDDGVETEKPLVEVCGTPMLDRVHDALAGSRIERVYAVVSPNAPATRERAHDLPCDVIETPGEGYVDDLDRALDQVGRPVLTVAADLPLLAPRVVNRVIDVAERLAKTPGQAEGQAKTPNRTEGQAKTPNRTEGQAKTPNRTEGQAKTPDRTEATGVPSLTACVPAALKRQLGVSVDTTFTPAEVANDPRVVPAEYTGWELAPTGVNVVGDSAEAIWVSHDARLTVNVNRAADLDVATSLCAEER